MAPKPPLPTNNEFDKATQLASQTVEATEYLVKQFSARLYDANKLNSKILEALNEFVLGVKHRLNSATNPWQGEVPTNAFFNTQENLANEAAKALKTGEALDQEVQLDFAISEISELIRGYSANGQPLAQKVIDALDKMFNAWFAKNNIINQDSVLYESTQDGKIKEKDGQQVRALPEEVIKIIKDVINGLKAYIEKQSGINMNITEHPYPAEVQPTTQTGRT